MAVSIDRRRALFVGAAPLALFAACAPAAAQEAPGVPASQTVADAVPASADDPAQGAAAADQADIIVVGTAGGGTRRQDAAFSVTSLNNDAIKQLAPSSTADLLKSVPGVSAESSGGQNGANIFVRGFPSGGDAEFVTVESSGVPIFPPPTLSFLENTQLIQIDETLARVEAVRGGTGALFSAGQPGLTVNFVQREGGQTFSGLAKISVTDFGLVRGDALISGPIDQNTTFLVGGFYEGSHGIRDPQFTSEKGGQITANIRHDFGKGSVLLYGRYLNNHGQWLLPIPVIQNGTDISSYPGFDAGDGALPGRDTRITTVNDGSRVDLADGRGAKVGNFGINFDYELAEGLKVRERASYLVGDANTFGLVPATGPQTAASFAAGYTLRDGTDGPIIPGSGTIGSLTFADGSGPVPAGQQVLTAGIWQVRKHIKSFVNDLSFEFRSGNNTLTVGGYYAAYSSRDFWNLGNNLLLTAESNARRLNLVLADGRVATRDGFTSGASFNVNADYTGKDYAGYAVDELQITEKLRLDAGVRYQQHNVDGRLENNTFGVNTDGNAGTLYNNNTAVLNGTFSTIRYRGNEFSFTGGANYDLSNQVGFFARYSRGNSFPFFDNLRDGNATSPQIDSYEGGLKVTANILNLYATVFHNNFRGLVTSEIIGGVPVASTGGARTTGVEIEGAIRPAPGLSLAFGGTYLDAKYKDYFSNGGLTDDTGNRVQRQPKWQWRLTPSYTADVIGGTATAYATVAYIGDRFSDPDNTQLLPHYYTLDAGISFKVAPRFEFRVSGDNLTNTIALTEGNPRAIGSQGSGPILARPILGRSFMASAQIGF